MSNLDSSPIWRRRFIGVAALLVIVALVVAACAIPSVRPQDSAPADANQEVADSADNGSAASDSSGDEGAEAETAETNPADAYAVEGEPTGEYLDIPVGLTVGGLPFRGDPEAPIIMVEYSDYQCPFCGRHFVQTDPALMENYVRNGQVRQVFVEFPLEGLHPNAPAAHEAALCVLDQGSVENYWKMHSGLFRSAEEWGSPAEPTDVFVRLAEESGADVDAFRACLEDGGQLNLVNEMVDYATNQGFRGTPSFQLIRVDDGAMSQFSGAQPYDEFERQIELLLSGEMPEPQEQAQESAAEIPFWATEEGWQPDPGRPGYNMAGDLYKGDLDAPIKVIEFSDFQCPYCKRHAEQTQSTLDEQYVDTGQVLWVFKHFPLDIHPQAPAAGVAAECAAEQGQFWEMAKLLFDAQQDWSVNDPTPVFSELADELGLDTDAFSACLDDPAMAERVSSDMADGAPFVQGTPTFIILHAGSGSIVPGALPVDSFVQLFDELLAADEGS